MPQLSIILPVYNCERYVGECIESILRQDFADFELIIIDDGSTDSSPEICARYSSDSRVWIITKENGGVSVARNTGMSVASAPLVMFVDSDDMLSQGMLSEMVGSIHGDDTDLCVCGLRNFHDGPGRDETWSYRSGTYTSREYADVLLRFYTNPFVGGPVAKIYKKAIIDGGLLRFEEGESFAEDFVFNMRYLRNVDRVSVLSEPYYLRRADTPASLSKSARPQPPLWERKKVVFAEWGETLDLLSGGEADGGVLIQRLAVDSVEAVLLSGDGDAAPLVSTVIADTDGLARGRMIPSYRVIRAACRASLGLCSACLRLACSPAVHHNPVFRMLNR